MRINTALGQKLPKTTANKNISEKYIALQYSKILTISFSEVLNNLLQ